MAGSTDAVPVASSIGAVACLAPIATAAPPKLMGKSKIASLTCLGSAISCASLVVSVYLLPFWTDVIGVGPQFMGIVIICAKVAEAVSVVSAGIFSDSCMIRFGRRRPFLIFCIPAAVLYALLFNPPQDVVSSGGAASAWVLTVGIAFYGVWPYLTVCHSSWCAEYCRDYVERNVLYGFRFFFGTIGTITGAVLPLIVAAACGLSEQVLDEKIRINHYVGISVAVIIAVVSLLVLAFVSENSRQNSDSSVWKALVSWVLQAFGAIRHSRTVRVHMLMSFLYDIALAYAVSFLPYMTSRVHKLRTTLVLGSYVVMSLICIPVWLKVSQYYEKNHVLSAACASQSGFMMAAGLVKAEYAYWGLLLAVALSSAGVLVMLGSMRADVCDSETVRVGKHREAVQISSCDVLNRLAGGLTFVGLFILQSGGYTPIVHGNSTKHGDSTGDSTHIQQALSENSTNTIRALHCFFPAACVAVAGLVSLLHRLDRSQHSKLVQAIAAIDASAVVEFEQQRIPSSSTDPSACNEQPAEADQKVQGSALAATPSDQVYQA